mgnify:CR=1 FL=1
MTLRHIEIAGKRRHLSGWRKDKPDPRDKQMAVPFLARFSLPNKVSMRGMVGLVVEDQAEIGSCTYNASSSLHEFVIAKLLGSTVVLSRLWGYAKGREMEGTPLTEDSGSEIRNAVKLFATLGCPEEVHWPYDTSKFSVRPPDSILPEAAKHKALLYYRCGNSVKPSLLAIKASLAQGFPVVGGFSVPENMMSAECARSGFVEIPARGEGFVGGHAVLFTGYNDRLGVLEFMNSWSKYWGDGGYGYLPYVFITEGYADDFWTIRRAT